MKESNTTPFLRISRLVMLWVALLAISAGPLRAQMAFPPESPNDSGMWLLPQITGPVYAELHSKGLQLTPEQIYSQDQPSLNQAIVRINIGQGGGGTGSFVSPDGLILTNHHVGYDATASASTADRNYLDDGFYAKTRGQEIEAEGYSLYIPIEQSEVTGKLASMVPDSLQGQARAQKEKQARQQLIDERKGDNDDLVVEIDDYWAGNRQFMAVYRVIRDVRLVYAPPSSIGKYGGDIDNWMWPRHTGDYTFLRAYVSPDGKGRAYNEENVPFHPSRHLKINADGVTPGDYTMVLGFPGSTYRHQSSYAFDFYQHHRNGYIIQSLQAVLDGLELAAKNSKEAAVENASDRASVANSLKYYQGVQEGFKNYHIVAKKKKEEQQFQKWIRQDSARQAQYGQVLPQLEKAFSIAGQSSEVLYSTLYALNYNQLMKTASLFEPFYSYLQQPDSVDFTKEQKQTILEKQRSMLNGMDLEAQTLMLSEMLYNLQTLPEDKGLAYLYTLFDGKTGDQLHAAISDFLQKQREESIVFNPDKAEKLLNMRERKARKRDKDDMVQLFDALRSAFQSSRQNYMNYYPYMRPARKLYVQGMLEMRDDSTEYPDANFTLRMSGGRVMGYSPKDGVYNLPFTTFEGMIAKDTDREPFDAPQALEDYYAALQAGDTTMSRYAMQGHLPVNFLSTNDITGGNSGSPVLDSNGNVIGLAFDGNIEGVVGDYYYDPALNRTISLDVRYLLFLMEQYDKTDRLLNEMEIIHTPVENVQAEAAE